LPAKIWLSSYFKTTRDLKSSLLKNIEEIGSFLKYYTIFMDEKEIKKDIAKRLRMSDKKLWKSVTEEEQNKVVNEYYHTSDIERVGVARVLEENRDLRRNFGFLILGVILGIVGNLFASILLKHMPQNSVFDGLVILFFLVFFFYLVREIKKIDVENLAADKVLKYLLKKIQEEK
jgi:hypothetical protein